MTITEQVRILLDEASAPVFWTDVHIQDALNTGQLAALPLLPRESLVKVDWIVPAGDELVPLPDTIMIPKWVEDSEKQFLISTYAELERYSHTWKGTTPDIPQYFILHDHSHIRPYPRANENYLYTLVGVPWPTEISSPTIDPISHETLKGSIAHFAASDLLLLTQPQISLGYERQAMEMLQQFKRESRNTHSHNIFRIAPSRGFGCRQQGGIR